jgi:hypothetical protein
MTPPRRLRGFIGTIITWGSAFALVSILIVGALGLAGQLPPADIQTIGLGLFRIGLRWGLIGAGIGTLFAGTVMLAERKQHLGSLSSRRFAVWGFAAGAAVPLILTVATRLAGHSSSNADVRLALVFALVCGGVGAGVALMSLRWAQRADGARAYDRAPVI